MFVNFCYKKGHVKAEINWIFIRKVLMFFAYKNVLKYLTRKSTKRNGNRGLGSV